MPRMVGIFHTFVRGVNSGPRDHRVFVAVTGGCSLAASEFLDIVQDSLKYSQHFDVMSTTEWLPSTLT